MTVDPVLIYLLLFAVSALVLLMVGLVLAYMDVFRKYANLKKLELSDNEIDLLFKETKIKLRSITDTASKSARELLTNARFFTDKQLRGFEEEVNKATRMYLNLYQRTLEDIERETAKNISEIPGRISDNLSADLRGVGEQFRQDVLKITEKVREDVEQAYKNVEIDVEEYKKARLSQIDKGISELILQIARKVLAKEINKDEHEKLVMKALDDAKKSGMFTREI